MSKSTLSSSIADLRKSYERAELSEDASLADPLQQFDQWLHEAVNAQVNEPNAMTVATVSTTCAPPKPNATAAISGCCHSRNAR